MRGVRGKKTKKGANTNDVVSMDAMFGESPDMPFEFNVEHLAKKIEKNLHSEDKKVKKRKTRNPIQLKGFKRLK